MKSIRLTLGQLLKRIDIGNDADTETVKDASTDATETGAADPDAAKKDDDDEDSDDDDDSDDESEGDGKKKKKGSETPEKSASETKATVSMAVEDYNSLVAFAAGAEKLRADNTSLKVKADQWDAYQEAIGGTQANGDSAGAGKKADEKSAADPHANLRTKYGSLMEGL